MPTIGRAGLGCAVWGLALLTLVALGAAARASPWVEVDIPEEGQGTYEALHFITADEGWVLSRRQDGGRLRLDTFDGGKTWEVQAIDEDAYRTLLRARFADPLNGWAHADLTGDMWFDRVDGHNPGEDNSIDAPAGFLRTTDGGRTWRRHEGAISAVTYFGDEALARDADRKYLSAIRFVNDRVGMMAGILGATREHPEAAPYIVYRGHALLTTRDGGGSWDMALHGDAAPDDRIEVIVSPPLPIPGIELLDESVARVAAHGVRTQFLFRTDDGAKSWETLVAPWPHETPETFGDHILFVTPHVGWSWGFPVGLTSTRDAGASWFPAHDTHAHRAYFETPERGWILSSTSRVDTDGIERFVPLIRYTADGGATWAVEYEAPQVNGITHWELLYQTLRDPATDAVWTYGFRALLRRFDPTTLAPESGVVWTTWGGMKFDGHQ